MFCPNCGKENLDQSSFCFYCGCRLQQPASTSVSPQDQDRYAQPPMEGSGSQQPYLGPSNMRTWKLVSGIISITLFLLVSCQSCVACVADLALGGSGGVAGLLLSMLMLAGGIVSIAARDSTTGGNIALIVLYSLAAIIGYGNCINFPDLFLWSTWCLVCAVLAVICLIRNQT